MKTWSFRRLEKMTAILIVIMMLFSGPGMNNSFAAEEDEKSFAGQSIETLQSETDPIIASDDDAALSKLTVKFLNIGCGDSALLECEGKYLLIDAGVPTARSGKVVNPAKYLSRQGITHLDYVICSHDHRDHTGRIPKIITKFDCGKVYISDYPQRSYKKVRRSLKKKGITASELKEGETLSMGSVSVCAIHIPKGTDSDPGDNKESRVNNSSYIIMVTHGKKKILFMGDALVAEQRALLSSGADIRCDVFKVPHHGHNNAFLEQTYKAASPTYTVLSASRPGRGKPDGSVQQYLESNSKLLYTFRNGTITVTSDGNSISIETER